MKGGGYLLNSQPEMLAVFNEGSLAGPASDQAPEFVVLVFVSNKFSCDHRFLLQVVHTKKGSLSFTPAGCSLELFQKRDFSSLAVVVFCLPL